MNDFMAGNDKIINKEKFTILREEFFKSGQKIVHCHGAFDLLHPGHIAHLEEAKSLGDKLVVSVTSAPYINKGPNRPFFSDELRMKSLAALSCVDYVLLAEEKTSLNILDTIKPDLYVKGSEYSDYSNDLTQNIDKEIDKVKELGGDVHFTTGVVFSSTKLINNEFPIMAPNVADFSKEFTKKYNISKIVEFVEKMKSLKVLVIGDIIIDEYIFCSVQGLMSKDRGFSVRYLGEDKYLGGTLAVARHLANFSQNVTVCSMLGNEPWVHTLILNNLTKKMLLNLQFDDNFRTIVKRRFIERHGMRNEYDKLFSINYLNEEDEKGFIDKTKFYDRLDECIEDYDIVVVSDFGHGLIDTNIINILEQKSKLLCINCQANSSNYGMNLITKYKRADVFSIDEKEIRLTFNSRHDNVDELLKKLFSHFNSQNGWLTLGSMGAIGMSKNLEIVRAPALTLTVQDTVGAGDAFYSLAALTTGVNAPIEIGTFLGSIAGALKANVIGNSSSIKKVDLLKFAASLLNI